MRFLLSFMFIFVFSHTAFSKAPLQVGLASTIATPDISEQIPLGGYGSFDRRNWPFRFHKYPYLRYFRVAQGELDSLRMKTMYLENEDSKLLLISLDVIGVTQSMRQDLVKRLNFLGLNDSQIIVSATHTHAGPGALANNFFWEVLAMGRFQNRYYEEFLGQLVDTVKLAVANKTPAELFTLSFETTDLVRNRRRDDGLLDRTANLLLAKSHAGEILGGVVNFAVHGTSLGSKNLFFSADAPGAIERELEALLKEKNGLVLETVPTMLFINGAQGDVSPAQDYLLLGENFARQASENWQNLTFLSSTWSINQTEVRFKKPKINLRKCIDKSWVPKGLHLGLKRYINRSTTLTQIKFGPLWFLTWPGEASTELGLELKTRAEAAGATEAWVFGLTNDHLAYFTSEEEWDRGGYETCVNFFGKHGGKAVLDAHEKLFTLDEDTL